MTRLELFPVNAIRPTKRPVKREARWRPALALAMTITGLLAGILALHRELRLQNCPVPPARHG